jgi:hypothetical protein
MPKSKTKNRERAKKLRQRKKQRDKFQSNNIADHNSMKNKLKQQYPDVDVQIRDKNNAKVKISNLVLQLIAPLMDEAKNFDEESNIVGLGVMAWNLGIIKASKGKKEMVKSLDNLGMKLPRFYKKLLMEYAEKKCIEFPDFDQIIYDYEFQSIDSKNNNLSVAYQSNSKE